MRVFFDTNVLVYLFDEDAPAKQERARQVLQEAVDAGRIVLSTQVLQEFYVAVTQKLERPVDPELAEQAVQSLTRLPVLPVDSPMILGAVRLARRHTLSFWDALIVESALAASASQLLTEDLQAGRRFDELEIVNPFSSL